MHAEQKERFDGRGKEGRLGDGWLVAQISYGLLLATVIVALYFTWHR